MLGVCYFDFHGGLSRCPIDSIHSVRSAPPEHRWAISLPNAPVIALIELSLNAIAIFNRIRKPNSQFAIRNLLAINPNPKDTRVTQKRYKSQQSLINNIGKYTYTTRRVIELSANLCVPLSEVQLKQIHLCLKIYAIFCLLTKKKTSLFTIGNNQ